MCSDWPRLSDSESLTLVGRLRDDGFVLDKGWLMLHVEPSNQMTLAIPSCLFPSQVERLLMSLWPRLEALLFNGLYDLWYEARWFEWGRLENKWWPFDHRNALASQTPNCGAVDRINIRYGTIEGTSSVQPVHHVSELVAQFCWNFSILCNCKRSLMSSSKVP